MTRWIMGCAGAVFCTGLAGMAYGQDLPTCERYPDGEPSYSCECTPGAARGSVWGSGPYTGDSALCAAAVHAGVIGMDGGAIVAIAKPGQDSYAGSEANGITTSNWGSYTLSVDLRLAKGQARSVAACDGYPVGEASVECNCAADLTNGAVWGSDPYTADSDLCSAARHAGFIDQSGGTIRALAVQGLDAYVGSDAGGVTTQSWGSYSDSFVFDWNFE